MLIKKNYNKCLKDNIFQNRYKIKLKMGYYNCNIIIPKVICGKIACK